MENSDWELLPKYHAMSLDPQAGGGSSLDPPQSLGAPHADSGEGEENAGTPAIHRIPIELICEILISTLPYLSRLGSRTVEQVPWHLGHICQQWRAAAIMSPLLWSSFTLSRRSAGCSSQTDLQTKVETQLRRSGSAPLHVVIDLLQREGDIVGQWFPETAVDLIIDQCHRWETACLTLNHASARQLGTRLARMKDRLPRLRLLELVGRRVDDSLTETFATAPRLETVYLCRCSLRPGSISCETQFPWAQVTKFRASYAYIEEFEGIFAAMNLAHVIEMGMFVEFLPAVNNTLHVVLPNLYRLNAKGSLPYITAPLLQELWITDHNESLWELPRFVQRSACRLSKLVVYGCCDTSAVIRALETLPTLKTFFISFPHLSGIGDPKSLFRALDMSSSETTLCPKLTHIATGNNSENEISLFLDMVESRKQKSFHCSESLGEPETCSAPSFVRVFHHGDMVNEVSEDTHRRVDGMRNEGLDIALDSHFIPSSHNYLDCDRP
ncbi:F-box domain-containing protein [Favolaschia claudopus]|uniref:F-box domain-containing protein n=1 Tax=Favolaschia claudopus TaxID=2862362 RepID=A0AAW0E2N9_9AGAR